MKYEAIVIVGPPMSGKSRLARELSDKYGWSYYSVGKIWRERWVQLYPNKQISFEEYWRNTSVEDNLKEDKKAKEIIKKRNVVVDVRYPIYCENLPVLLVLVLPTLQTRIEMALKFRDEYKNKLPEEVRKIIVDREMDEVRMSKKMYGDDYDYRDPKRYHITLNTGKLRVFQEINLINSLMTVEK